MQEVCVTPGCTFRAPLFATPEERWKPCRKCGGSMELAYVEIPGEPRQQFVCTSSRCGHREPRYTREEEA